MTPPLLPDDSEHDDEAAEDDAGDEARPRKPTRLERYRHRVARLTAELDLERRLRGPAGLMRDDDLAEPRQAGVKIRETLEEAGIEFIAENRGGPEVRLRRRRVRRHKSDGNS